MKFKLQAKTIKTNMKYLLLLCLLSANVIAEESYDIIPTNHSTPAVITADKTNGTISVYWPDTNTTITKPALFGKVKSNALNLERYDRPGPFNNITPAGSFPVTKMVSWRLNESMLVFINGKATVLAIHPLWNGNPDQRRIQRLNSPSPDDNRITGGCINVDETFFYSVLNQLPDGTILNILPEQIN
jgi:hypothetical protein